MSDPGLALDDARQVHARDMVAIGFDPDPRPIDQPALSVGSSNALRIDERAGAVTGLLVRKLLLRDQLSADEVDVVLSLSHASVAYERRQHIVRRGEPQTRSKILVEGWVARSNILVDGRRQITQLHVPGDFVDLHSFLLKRLEHDIVALTACTIAEVEHSRLREVTERYPHLGRLLWLTTLIDAAAYREWLTLMGRANAYQHVAFIICELYVRLESMALASDHVMDFPLTQEELGDVCGLTAIHINRVLQELRRDGLIVTVSRRLHLPDWDRLRQAAQFDPIYLDLIVEPR